MLLTLTNPVENITHVTLASCEEEDPDDINSTAKVCHVFHSTRRRRAVDHLLTSVEQTFLKLKRNSQKSQQNEENDQNRLLIKLNKLGLKKHKSNA